MNTEDFLESLVVDTDSYKVSHWVQYPPDSEYLNSYFESRGGEFPYTVFFGLQYFIKRFMMDPITKENVEAARDMWMPHMGQFNYDGWMHIVNKHGGFIPVEIEAVPEGSIVPTSNVLMQIRSTDHRVFWVTNYVETAAVRTWYPTSVATQSYHIRKMIQRWLDLTADDTSPLFKLHDFGSRGVSTREGAGIGGLAHLVNFRGTDTGMALVYGKRYYDEPMAGFSIPASEHSTMTAWGGPEYEGEAFDNMLEQYAEQGKMLACVSDSYDIMKAIDKWYKLRDKIINSGACLVVRPDSGEPVHEAVLAVMHKMLQKFGYEHNSKGFAVLPPYIRVIQGDGVNYTSINNTLSMLHRHGISAENIAFGMGGALLQKLNRDTQKFAFKLSAIRRSGQWFDVYKDPAGDHGKRSKPGILQLVHEDGQYKTIRMDSRLDTGTRLTPDQKLLKTRYINGRMLNTCTLEEVRQRAWG